jgi:hypothetical protein
VVEDGSPDDMFNHAKSERTRTFLGKISELYGSQEGKKKSKA